MKFLTKIQKNIISNPSINLIISVDRSINYTAMIDTGFDGYLCINEELAKLINLPSTGKAVATFNADGHTTLSPVALVHIIFGELDLANTQYSLPCILKPNLDRDIIIGSKLLNRFCNDNQLILCIDYANNGIYFKSS
jgi:predicted aspartyl protease